MQQTVKAVCDKDWRNCPECRSDVVQAIENGYPVEGISTDLMFCCECAVFYVVFPEWYFKGGGKARKLAAFPRDIMIEITEANIRIAEECKYKYREALEFLKSLSANPGK